MFYKKTSTSLSLTVTLSEVEGCLINSRFNFIFNYTTLNTQYSLLRKVIFSSFFKENTIF